MSRVRLIVEATSCDDRPSGARRRHLELWPRVLAAFGDRIEAVFLVSPGARPGFEERLAGQRIVEIMRTPTGPLGRLRVNRLLRRIAREPGAPSRFLVHQETLPLALPPATILCRHDARIHATELSSLPRRIYAGLRLPAVLRSVRRLVTVSESSAAEFGARTGLARERITVVPNGVEARDFARPDDLAARLAALGLEEGGYRFFLGHRERRKNPLFALEVEAALAAKGQGGRLVMAGRPTREGDLVERRIAKLGLPDRVLLLETPDFETRRTLLAGAGCVLVPSLVEGFSLVTLEALAAGAPLLCSDIPAHREVAGEPFCLPLHLALWRDAILEFAGSTEERARRREKGRLRVEHWSWDRAAEAMVALLDELLRSPTDGPVGT